jgi:hypothetical protein
MEPIKLTGEFRSAPVTAPSGAMTAPQMALQMIRSIKADMETGAVPVTVRTFSELHDYVDANEYLIEAYQNADEELDSASMSKSIRDNRAMDMVNVWLEARH